MKVDATVCLEAAAGIARDVAEREAIGELFKDLNAESQVRVVCRWAEHIEKILNKYPCLMQEAE